MRAPSLLLAFALAGCPMPRPVQAPEPDDIPIPRADGDLPPPKPVPPSSSDDAAVCAHLAMLGCNSADWCMGVLSTARSYGVTVPSGCLAGAPDMATVRRCGDTSTITFECR